MATRAFVVDWATEVATQLQLIGNTSCPDAHTVSESNPTPDPFSLRPRSLLPNVNYDMETLTGIVSRAADAKAGRAAAVATNSASLPAAAASAAAAGVYSLQSNMPLAVPAGDRSRWSQALIKVLPAESFPPGVLALVIAYASPTLIGVRTRRHNGDLLLFDAWASACPRGMSPVMRTALLHALAGVPSSKVVTAAGVNVSSPSAAPAMDLPALLNDANSSPTAAAIASEGFVCYPLGRTSINPMLARLQHPNLKYRVTQESSFTWITDAQRTWLVTANSQSLAIWNVRTGQCIAVAVLQSMGGQSRVVHWVGPPINVLLVSHGHQLLCYDLSRVDGSAQTGEGGTGSTMVCAQVLIHSDGYASPWIHEVVPFPPVLASSAATAATAGRSSAANSTSASTTTTATAEAPAVWQADERVLVMDSSTVVIWNLRTKKRMATVIIPGGYRGFSTLR